MTRRPFYKFDDGLGHAPRHVVNLAPRLGGCMECCADWAAFCFWFPSFTRGRLRYRYASAPLSWHAVRLLIGCAT